MSLTETLLSLPLMEAILGYLLFTLLVQLTAYQLREMVSEQGYLVWGVERIMLPAARALAIILFILLAYPRLYGLDQAPTLASLLSAEEGRFTHLLNLAVVISLLLPVLPVFGTRPAALLPIQGIAVSALLFHWLGLQLGVGESGFWPGWRTALLIAALALCTPLLARRAVWALEPKLRQWSGHRGLGGLLYEGLLLLFQMPAILTYSLSLGRHLQP